MEYIGADVAFGSSGGQVLQYFPDVDKLLVQTPDGLHHLVSPQEIHVPGECGPDDDIDALHSGHQAEVEWLERYSAEPYATPPRNDGSPRFRLGAAEPAYLSPAREPRPAPPPAKARAPLPDYSWYRDGFVRTDAVAERCAQSIQQWLDTAPSPRAGLLACTLVSGVALSALLPPPALRGPAGRGSGSAAVSIKVSLISQPTSVRRSQPTAATPGTPASKQRRSAGGRSSAAQWQSESRKNGVTEPGVRVPTAVNPLTCRRLPLFESAPVLCSGGGGGMPAPTSQERNEFASSQRRVCVVQTPALPPASGLARGPAGPTLPLPPYTFPASPAPVDAAVARAATAAPVLNWTCLESYLHFQVAMSLGAGAAAAATAAAAAAGGGRAAAAWQPPQQQRVIGHAIVRVCDILAGAVRLYAPGASPLFASLREPRDAPPLPPPPTEFFVRLLVPITPLHDDAPAASGAEASLRAALDVELSLVLPPGLDVAREFTQAYSRPPPAIPSESSRTAAQMLGVSRPGVGEAEEEAEDDGGDAAAFFLAKNSARQGTADEALPRQDEQHGSPSDSGGSSSARRVGSRWALGPGKEAREERLAKALAAYSNVRGLVPGSSPPPTGRAPPPPVPPPQSAEEVAAAAEAARTAALIRSSVAELQHSLEGIQAQLASQGAQMSEASALLSRGSVVSSQLSKAGLVSAVARQQQQQQQQQQLYQPVQAQSQPLQLMYPAGQAAGGGRRGAAGGGGVGSASTPALRMPPPPRAPYSSTTLPPTAPPVAVPPGGLLAASARLYSELSHVVHALGDGPQRGVATEYDLFEGAGGRRASAGGSGTARPTSASSRRGRPASAQPQRRRP